ncbi:MAG: hypothetical protein ACTSPY_15085 [Candidatus Helarchaeota archaeon]
MIKDMNKKYNIMLILFSLILLIIIPLVMFNNNNNWSINHEKVAGNENFSSSATSGVGSSLNVNAYADSENLSQSISILYNESVIQEGYVDQGLCIGFAANGSALNYDFLGGESYFSTADGFPSEGDIDGSGFQYWTKWTYHKEGDWNVLDTTLANENNLVYYFAFIIINRNPRNVQMSVGSDDGIKIWQNGNLVHTNNAFRPIAKDQDQFNIYLDSVNYFLVKINEATGYTSLAVHFKEISSGQNITDLIQCLGYDTTAKINLAGGWTAYHIRSNIYNLTDYNHWESNGGFDTSINPWSTSVNDPAGTTAVYSVSYASGTGNPAGSVYFRMYVDSTFGGTHTDANEYAQCTQTTAVIDRGEVIQAFIEFDYYAQTSPYTTSPARHGWNDLRFQINGGGSAYEKVYPIFENGQPWDRWVHRRFEIPSNLLSSVFSLPNTMSITIQVHSTASGNLGWGSVDDEVWLDNVKVWIKTKVRPTSVGLQLNSSNIIDQGYGSGYIDLTGSWSNPTENWDVIKNVYSTTSATVEFLNDIIVNVSKSDITSTSSGSSGTEFVTSNGALTRWTPYYYSYIPSGYFNYKFNFTFPSDWDVIEAWNPVPLDVLGSCTEGSNYLDIPISQAQNNPGWWRFEITSPNYVNLVNINQNTFSMGETIVISANINSDPQGIYTGDANLTITGPNGIWTSQKKSISTINGAVSFNIYLDASNSSVGTYNYSIYWDNGSITVDPLEAGEKAGASFNITHASNIVRDYPISEMVNAFTGETILLKVKYNDTDTGEGISGANVNLRINDWNGIGNHYIGSMIDYGAGIYGLDINTSGHNGYYSVYVSAQKNYFDQIGYTYLYNLSIIQDTILTYSFTPATPFGERTNITIYYKDDNNNPISGATLVINDTLDYNSPQYDSSTGSYWIDINTTDWNEGNYNIQVNASKSGYRSRSIIVPIIIRSIETTFTYDSPNPVVWGIENITTQVHYIVDDADSSLNGQGINSSQISGIICNNSLYALSYNYLGSGDYLIEVDTTSLSIGTHILQIDIINTNHFSNGTVYITIIIEAHRVKITYDVPSPTPFGQNTTVRIYYTDLENGSYINLNIPPDQLLVNSSNGEYTEISPGIYDLNILTDSYNIGSYHINITITKSKYTTGYVLIPITIRNHYMSFVNDFPAKTPYNNNATIYLYYKDLDNSSQGVNNLSGNVIITFQITSPTVPAFNYWIFDMYQIEDGKYNITIDTGDLPDIGIYTTQINITYIGGLYQNKTLTVDFEVIYRRTQFTYDSPSTVPYHSNSTIYLYYKDNDDPGLAGISNLTGNVIISARILSPSLIPMYWVEDLRSIEVGKYRFIINTSSLPSYGSYTIQINISWAAVPNFYQNKSISIDFSVAIITSSLTYTPPGIVRYSSTENATISINYYDVDHSIGIEGADITLMLINPTTYTFIRPINWTYYSQGNGDYIVHIQMDNLSLQTYTFQINVSKSNYIKRTLENVNLTIEGTLTDLISPEAPSSIISIGLYNITIRYIDRERGVSISNDTEPYVRINVTTSDTNSTWANQVNGNSPIFNATLISVGSGNNIYWVFLINTSNFNMGFTYNLTISASRQYAESKVINISLKLKNRESIMSLTYPPSQVWGNITTFTVSYTDLDGLYISGVSINLNWSLYSLIDNLDGTYDITLNTSAYKIGTYTIMVNASAPNFKSQTDYVFLVVRAIDSQVINQPPSTTPWRDNVTFWIEYRDIFNNVPINGSNISFDCNVTSGFWRWYFDSVIEGRLWVEINTSAWSTFGTYKISYNVNWSGEPYYQNKTTIISLTVRYRSTELIYPSAPNPVQYLQNGTITVQYRDVDNNNTGIDNSSGKVSLTLWWDNGLIIGSVDANDTYLDPGLNWVWINGQPNGYYNIIINTSQFNTIGTIKIIVLVNWSGQPYFGNTSTNFSLKINARSTDLSYIPPGTIGYGLNATISITYSDLELGGINNSNIYVKGPSGQFWNSSGQMWSIELGSGTYNIILNTTNLDSLGEFTFTIYANWSGVPFYANSSVQVNITLRARNTELITESLPTTPYGDLVNLTLFYNDLDKTLGIDNSSNNIYFNINLTTFTIYNLKSETAGKYVIEFNTADPMLGIGNFKILLQANCLGKPFYVNKTDILSITIRQIATNLEIGDYQHVVAWNDTISIVFKYNDTDHNQVGIQVYQENITSGWPSYTFTSLGVGIFRIDFNSNYTENTYTTWINVDVSPNYQSQNRSFSFTIRRIYTDSSNNASFVSNFDWGQLLTVEIEYIDADHDILIPNASLLVESGDPWTSGNYTISIINNKYYLILNTTYTQENVLYILNITLSKDHYVNQSFQVKLTIVFPTSNLYIIDIQPGTTVGWGDNLTFILTLNDSNDNSPISGAQLELLPTSDWPAENYSVSVIGTGIYQIEINTTWSNRPEGTYKITIQAEAPNYKNTSTAATINIRSIQTLLSLESAPSSIHYKSNFTILLNFNDTDHNVGLDSCEFDVYYKNSTGYLHPWEGIIVNGKWSYYENATPGLYTIILNSSTNLGLGNFLIYINASLDSSWGVLQDHYDSGYVEFTLQIVEIETSITAIDYPASSIPWGDLFNISIEYEDTINNVGIQTPNISVSDWTDWSVYYQSNGIYNIVINSSTVSKDQFNQILLVTIHANKSFYVKRTTIVNVIIRPIATSLSYVPPPVIPYNNSVNITVNYRDIDHNLGISNDTGNLKIIVENSYLGSNYIIINSSTTGSYIINIDSHNLPSSGIYSLNISVYWYDSPYYSNQSLSLDLTIRNISLLLTMSSIDANPWSDNLELTINLIISDSASIHDKEPINNATITLNYSTISIISKSNGTYTITINGSELLYVGTYGVWIAAQYPNCSIVNSTFHFEVRSRLTDLVYTPPDVVPYLDNAIIHVKYSDLDNSSFGITNSTGSVKFFIYNSSGYLLPNSVAWTLEIGNGYYDVYIKTDTLSGIGKFQFKIEANWTQNNYYDNSSINVEITVRARNTVFSYDAPGTTYYGDQLEINLYYLDLDSGFTISNGTNRVFMSVIIDNNLSCTDYIIIEQFTPDLYILRINTSAISTNKLGYHIVDVNVSYKGFPYFQNRSVSIQFNLREIITDYYVLINGENTLAYSGLIWGDNVSVLVYYNNTDTGSYVLDSNIEVTGESVYQNGNYSIVNNHTGLFLVEIAGNKGEHGVNYHFHINLYKNEIYRNQSFTISISFRKPVTTIIIHEDLTNSTMSWGDNITITFSYNNTEIENFPGIPSADINYSIYVDQKFSQLAMNYSSWKEDTSLGVGVYVITMNTTWVVNLTTTCKFIIQASVPNALIYETIYYVEITSISTQLNAITWNDSVYIEQYTNFNVTVRLMDLDHISGINNNSDPRYSDIHFYFKKGGKDYPLNTWEYGNITIMNSTELGALDGTYNLILYWNASIKEELDYVFFIKANGTYIRESETQIVVSLIFRIHQTNITMDPNYAKNVSSNPNFPLFNQAYDGTAIFGDIVNITLFYYDIQPGYEGNGTAGAYIVCNWTFTPYRIYYMDELIGPNWTGIYIIEIDTSRSDLDMINNWTIQINITKETSTLIYAQKTINLYLNISRVPTELLNYTIIEPIPWGDTIKLYLNYTNTHTNKGIPSPDTIEVLTWNQTDYWWKWIGYGRFILYLYSDVKELGVYNATVRFSKLNYRPIIKNFTIIIRNIRNEFLFNQTDPISGIPLSFVDEFKYKESGQIDIIFQVNDSYLDGTRITNADFQTNWTGTYQIIEYGGITSYYRIILNADIDIGTYKVNFTFNKLHYEKNVLILNITIIRAVTDVQIDPNIPGTLFNNIQYQFFGFMIQFRFVIKLDSGQQEIISSAHITYNIYSTADLVNPVASGVFQNVSGKVGFFKAFAPALAPGNYLLIINATPSNNNLASDVFQASFTVLPFYRHPLFILTMVAIGIVAGALVYRQVVWWLKPYQIKEIIKAQRLIKKKKEEVKFPVVRERDEMFIDTFHDYWASLNLKVPKLVDPEIVAFATEISSILRTRITTPEAEILINQLKSVSQLEAEHILASKNVPPEAAKRLLTIIGVIKKEREEVLKFMEKFKEIKDLEITYDEADDIIKKIRKLEPKSADQYLESLVIPKEGRIELLGLLGITLEEKYKKGKKKIEVKKKVEPKTELAGKKTKEIQAVEKEPEPETPLTDIEILKELDKIPNLTEKDKQILLSTMKHMTLKEQKEFLEELK